MPFTIQLIEAKATRPIRQQVLRPGQDFSTTHFAGDEIATTFHLGGFLEQQLVCVVSLYQRPAPAAIKPQVTQDSWQLRGMATLAEQQGRGFGAKLLQHALSALQQRSPGGVVWANARVTALALYQRAGFEVIGEGFEIDNIGLHYLISKSLAG